VDATAQVIVACDVTQEATDVRQFLPMLERVQANVGTLPEIVTADAGYFSEANVEAPLVADIDVYVPPNKRVDGRERSGQWAQRHSPPAVMMRARLMTTMAQEIYARRKAIVEPVFGQAKEVRRFRRFSLRGYRHASGEWTLVCLTHNLLKLFRARRLCSA
jgi:IS5 family transposase